MDTAYACADDAAWQVPSCVQGADLGRRCMVPNGAAVLVTVYGAYYLTLEPVAGASWALLVALPLYLSANAFWQVGLHKIAHRPRTLNFSSCSSSCLSGCLSSCPSSWLSNSMTTVDSKLYVV